MYTYTASHRPSIGVVWALQVSSASAGGEDREPGLGKGFWNQAQANLIKQSFEVVILWTAD